MLPLYCPSVEQSTGTLDFCSATCTHYGFLVTPEFLCASAQGSVDGHINAFSGVLLRFFQTQLALNIENLALLLCTLVNGLVFSDSLVWIWPCKSLHLRCQSMYNYCTSEAQRMTLHSKVSAKT